MATQSRTRQQGKAPQNESKLSPDLAFHLAGREASRNIKLHNQQNQTKATSVTDAVVRSGNGMPDMRFAENRNLFEQDTSKKVNGDPDRRFVENRPDLIEVRRNRGSAHSNLILTPDMIPDDVRQIAEETMNQAKQS